MRKLSVVLVPLLLLALVQACGGDDDSPPDGTASPASTAGQTDAPSPTEGPSASPTPEPTPTPTFRPVTADFYARVVGGEAAAFLTQTFEGRAPVPRPCDYDAENGIIDCRDEGYGTIALDIPPEGNVTECRALLFDIEMRAVSCSTDEPAGWIYRLEAPAQ